jgi:hypothetical protein
MLDRRNHRCNVTGLLLVWASFLLVCSLPAAAAQTDVLLAGLPETR